MARSLRVECENGWYHVTNRGNNRQAIYLDDRDRRHGLELLAAVVDRHGVEIHAYVLMPNHYHLLVRTPNANLSAAIQWLNTAYAIWWNRRHERGGHVFQGRFKAVPVEAGEWALACSLYVHFNPVAIEALALSKARKAAEAKGLRSADPALLAKRLEMLRGFRWSSYGSYAGYCGAPPWLTTAELWGRTGGCQGYRELAERRVNQGQEESLWSRLKWGVVLGGERFVEEVRQRLKTNRESGGRTSARRRCGWGDVVRAVEEARGERWADFCNRHGDPGLAMALHVARHRTGVTLRELGEAAGGMDYSAVAAALRRFDRLLPNATALRTMTQNLLKAL